jgi:lysylphosphatidylglycerol synthetase-like protein (DUF2156 family)
MADDNDPGTTTGAAGGGNDTGKLLNFARGAKGIALLCFLFPFVTVSCAGQTIGQISGIQLATGTVGQIGQNMPGAPSGGGAAASQSHGLDIFALGALLLIVGALVATFVMARRRAALIAMVLSAVAAVLLVFDVFVRIKGAAEDSMRQSAGAAAPSAGADETQRQVQQQMEQMVQQISVNPAIGFWLCVVALIAAIVLLNMVRSRGTDL